MAFKDTLLSLFSKENKTVPPVDTISEEPRGGAHKEVTSNFLYKPPYGYPRYLDFEGIRNLATCPTADMAINAIVDEISSIEWDIVAEDDKGNIIEGRDDQIKHVTDFFHNPNTNPESWNQLIRKVVRDVLELDSGILVKVFNQFGDMVELVVRDGATFTKNPDIHGMFTFRDDIIFEQYIYNLEDTAEHAQIIAEFSGNDLINSLDARERAAYFQFGWRTGSRAVPFGKKEIVWFEKNARADDHYGRSPLMVLFDTIQTLIYSIEHNLDFFRDNSIPTGVLALEGSSTDEIKAFKLQWENQQRKKDDLGRWKKLFHKLPIVNKKPTFVPLTFNNAELQLLEGQKWWSKLVWACFGVTPTELGFTEDAKGMANQIVQSNVFKKRSINPLLRLIEYHVNKQIMPEFGYDNLKFKYQMFDVEEEMKKTQLFKLEIDTGIKTVNEVRNALGMDDVEWGDEDPKRNSGNNFNMNMPGGNEESRNSGQRMRKEAGKEKEGKALNTQTDLILRDGETMSEAKLRKSMKELLETYRKSIMDILGVQGKDQLSDIKAITDIPDAVKEIFTINEIRLFSDAAIKSTFFQSWDDAEKQLNMNINMNQHALKFLQDHTFDNIVDMSEEIKNDLRAELERGIINGEGVNKLKARVNKIFDKSDSRVEAIARTEVNRAEGNGRLLAFKDSGVEGFKKKWDTHHDDRTTAICKRLDGQTVGIDENFKDSTTGWEGQTNPSHVNCRSSVIYVREE